MKKLSLKIEFQLICVLIFIKSDYKILSVFLQVSIMSKADQSFKSEKSFNDFVHFPRGIRRSGHFSVRESAVLENDGEAMTAIYNGERKPATSEEKEFLKELKETSGDFKQALDDGVYANDHAMIMAKYLVAIGPRRIHRLCDNKNDVAMSSSGDMGGDDSGDSSAL